MATLGSEPHPFRILKNAGPAAGDRPAAGSIARGDISAAIGGLWSLVRPQRRLLWGSLILTAVNRAAGLVLPGSTKFLIDGVIGRHLPNLLLPLVATVVVAAAVQGVTSYVLTRSLAAAAQRLIAELRIKVHAHVIRLPIAYYDANGTGALASRVMNDVEGIRIVLGSGLIQFVGGLLTSAIAAFVLLYISPILTATALPILAGLGFAIWRSFRVLRPMFRERSVVSTEISGSLAESLAGIRVVRTYQAEPTENAKFAMGVHRLLDNAMRTLAVSSTLGLASSIAIGLASGLIMLIGAHQIEAGALTVGELFAYVLFLGFLVVPLAQIAGVGSQFGEAISGLERTRELLSEPTEQADSTRSVSLPTIVGDILFEDVSFAYSTGEPVLKGISFHARAGTVTALVGSSGSGKSTIIGLVAGFYRPSSGRVVIDGVDLSAVRMDSYRSQLAAVLQDSFVFNGTIRENIAFSRPAATEAMVKKACDIAHVTEFAERLAGKYDTVVGERGVRLSGGQRQRVSIARAVLADPRILILDEATSNLDSASESLIQDGLRRLMRGRTTLVIAHRLSTIRSAEQILVIEGGRIVERGDHVTLYEARGRYHQLYESQHRRDANVLVAGHEGPNGDEGASSLTSSSE